MKSPCYFQWSRLSNQQANQLFFNSYYLIGSYMKEYLDSLSHCAAILSQGMVHNTQEPVAAVDQALSRMNEIDKSAHQQL